MDQPKPRFTGIFIPVEILEMEELSLLEQLLLAWIDALYCDQHGGCYASNEYLASRLKVQQNTIAKALTHLRSLGLLEDVSFDGRHRVIRALINKKVDECQSKAALDKNPTQGVTKIQGCVGQKSIPSYVYIKEENKEERGADAPSAAVSESSKKKKEPKPTKSAFRDNVLLTQKEHDDLLADVGQEPLDWMLDKLSSHKAAKGQTYKSDAATMRNGGWVRDALHSRRTNNSTNSYAKQNNKMRVADTGEYSSQKHWDEIGAKSRERLKKDVEEIEARIARSKK